MSHLDSYKQYEGSFNHLLGEKSSQRKVRPYLNVNVLYMSMNFTQRLMNNTLASVDRKLVEAIRYMYSIDKINKIIHSLENQQETWETLVNVYEKKEIANNLTFSKTKKFNAAPPKMFLGVESIQFFKNKITKFQELVVNQLLECTLDKQLYDEMYSMCNSGEYFENGEAKKDFDLIADEYFHAQAFEEEAVKTLVAAKVDSAATWVEEINTFEYSLESALNSAHKRKGYYYTQWDEVPLIINVAKEDSMNIFVHYGFQYMHEVQELEEQA